MSYSLTEINYRTVTDPKGLIEEGDAAYAAKVETAAERILANLHKSPIVLLSGPSGSGKTTTSMKIAETLNRRGVGTHYAALDDYFRTVEPATVPRTPEGEIDLESPLCLDLPLLNRHFSALERGEPITVPRYDFRTRSRAAEPGKTIRAGRDEAVIFEGIHALNDRITQVHPAAFKLYISAQSTVEFQGATVFKSTWFRLVRRTVRDSKFRGSRPEETMRMWANIRRGEKQNVSPFQNKADYRFDSAFPYELPVMNVTATALFRSVPEGVGRYEELRQVLPALQLFGTIDESLVAPDAMIREFIGGGIYTY